MHEPQHHLIKESDVRAIVRTLSAAAIGNKSIQTKRQKLMKGLADLIDADAWVWGIYSNHSPGELPQPSLFMHEGFNEDQLGAFVAAQNHPDMADLNAPFMEACGKTNGQVTRLRQQIDPENTFANSEVIKLWKQAGVAPLIVSSRLNHHGHRGIIGLYRKFDRLLFDERELRIAHILLTEITWLHEESWPKAPTTAVAKLAPRLNSVLNLMLAGQCRKQIAASLGVTVNTINGYVRELYTRFNVHSQAELICRFTQGDGGDGI